MIADLPVWRSPMISSRWPRPIGISASIAFRPVAIGSCTDLRGMMPGAFTSTRRRSVASIGPLPSIGLPSAVDDAAEQALADRHLDDGAGALDRVAFLDLAVGAEDHDADIVDLEVQRHAADAVLEGDHLAGLHVVEAVDAGDAVADGEHLPDFGDFRLLAEILDLLAQDGGNFRGPNIHQPTSLSCVFTCHQSGAERRVDHARADLHDEPAEDRRIDARLERHVLAELVLQRRLQRGDLLVARADAPR